MTNSSSFFYEDSVSSEDITTVSTYVTQAAASKDAAAASAASATNSATSASNSASAASVSASNAATSASTATTKAGDAATYASNAATSAGNAATSASAANTSATNSASSATTAANSASLANDKAVAASASASGAAASATTATTQAASAGSSASSAATSATNSANSATLSQNWATLTGSEVVTGQGYSAKQYSLNAAASATAAANSAAAAAGGSLLAANNLSDLTNKSTARTNLGLSTVAATGAYSDLSGKPTLGSLAALSTINNSNWSGTQLSVASGGTGLTSLTAGYIPFGNGTGALGNSSNLFWDSANGRLGVGTSGPGAPVDTVANSGAIAYRLRGRAADNIADIQFTDNGATNAYVNLRAPAANTFAILTGGTERMRIDSAGRFSVGDIANTYTMNLIGQNLTGQTYEDALTFTGYVLADVTDAARGIQSRLTTTAASFTLGNLMHFYANPRTKGSGSTITNQYGYYAESTLTGATNNYGFFGNIASGSNRWNFYAAGDAQNYFAGNVGIGITPTYKLDVSGVGRISSGLICSSNIGSNPASAAGGIDYNSATSDFRLWSFGAGQLLFLTNGSERMRIDSAGNVGIGTSSFGTSAAKVIGIANGTAPTTSPAGMGQLYVEGGALKYRGSSGTVTTIAAA